MNEAGMQFNISEPASVAGPLERVGRALRQGILFTGAK